MASLKDMRVRIAATKATQKITKAMQMVAASKLRRAQSAAVAARPYAEHMGKVLDNIARAIGDLGTARFKNESLEELFSEVSHHATPQRWAAA